MPRMRRRGALQQTTEAQLELRPLMNVIIVLIPMLLLSAVFMEIRAIEIAPPPGHGQAPSETASLGLAVHVLADRYVIEGHGLASQQVARDAAHGDAALRAALASIVAAHPGTTAVRILAEPGTRYQDLISAMDTARSAGLSDTALEGA